MGSKQSNLLISRSAYIWDLDKEITRSLDQPMCNLNKEITRSLDQPIYGIIGILNQPIYRITRSLDQPFIWNKILVPQLKLVLTKYL